MHAENIIACGDRPFIIDYECSLKPLIKHPNCNVKRHLVTHTHLLPTPIFFDNAYKTIDPSGINGSGNQETAYKKITWLNIGTDEMRLDRETSFSKEAKNIPFLVNSMVDPLDYESDLKTGFNECYQVILNNKKYLLSHLSILKHFKNSQIRILLRSTETYSKLLTECYHPILLHQEKKYFEHFNWLEKSYLPEYNLLSQCEAEKRDLYSTSIPYFYSKANEKIIYDSNGSQISINVTHSAFFQTINHLKHVMNKQDLSLQLILIENSYLAAKANKDRCTPIFTPLKIDAKPIYTINKAKTDALEIATSLLDKLVNHYFIVDNKICWPLIKSVSVKKWSISCTDVDLYDGISGIGITFAYAAKIFHKKSYANIANKCLKSLLNLNFKNIQKIGGFQGLGSIIYALNIYNQLSFNQKIKSNIYRYIALAGEYMNQDHELDVLSGTAGFILSLFSVRELIEKKKFISILSNSVNHLYKHYPHPDFFSNTFSQYNCKSPLLGFSHGVAGIILALARANTLLHESKINDWIRSALLYERKHFDIIKKNWPDFRSFDKFDNLENRFKNAWCHGAPGIGLSRIVLKKYWFDENIDKEITDALYSTITSGFNTHASLCHGSLGNLELLLSASDYFSEAKHAFNSIFPSLIKQFKSDAMLLDFNGKLSLPGLMNGISGIAYQLMRCVHPEKIPSILTLQTVL